MRDTPTNRARAAKASIAASDIDAAVALFDGEVLFRDNDMSCYVNMDELATFAEARNTPADIAGGAGELGDDAQDSDATHVGPALCPTCPTEPAAKSDKIPQNSASAEIDDDAGRNAELDRL